MMTEFPFSDVDFSEDDIVSHEVVPHVKAATERSLARRLALQALYEIDTTDHSTEAVIAHFLARGDETLSLSVVIDADDPTHVDVSELVVMRKVPGEEEQRVVEYFQRLVRQIERNRAVLDAVLQTYASDFPIQQVAVVDRNILRIALYEIVADNNVPTNVAIDEAVELSKLFGADGTTRFVNGVLGAIATNNESVRRNLRLAEDARQDNA
jgi:N utilization substance protein B